MIEKINQKILKEAETLLSKEELTIEELKTLIDIKNDLKLDEKMKKMIELTF